MMVSWLITLVDLCLVLGGKFQVGMLLQTLSCSHSSFRSLAFGSYSPDLCCSQGFCFASLAARSGFWVLSLKRGRRTSLIPSFTSTFLGSITDQGPGARVGSIRLERALPGLRKSLTTSWEVRTGLETCSQLFLQAFEI